MSELKVDRERLPSSKACQRSPDGLEGKRKADRQRRIRILKRERVLGWIAFLVNLLFPFYILLSLDEGLWLLWDLFFIGTFWVLAYVSTLKLADCSLQLGYLEGVFG